MRSLLDAVSPALVRTLRAVLGSGHPELDDVLQDALLGLVRALPSFRRECSVQHFAVRIAVRRAVRARRRARFWSYWFRGDEPADPDSLAAPVRDGAADDRRRLVRGLLRELPERQAEALALKVMLGHSVDEIASMTGAPLNTIRTRLQRARETLRRRIEQDPRFADLCEVAP
jgi:RNA polymerase sigma-70 factor (ECF subfamily)